MSKHNIELPPLPLTSFHARRPYETEFTPNYSVGHMRQYARAAIEADRQRRGEPVAWQWLDTAHFRKKIPSHSNAEEWRPLFTAPQPAEPVKVNAIFETEDDELIGTTDAKVKRVEWQDDGSLTVVIDYWPQPAAMEQQK